MYFSLVAMGNQQKSHSGHQGKFCKEIIHSSAGRAVGASAVFPWIYTSNRRQHGRHRPRQPRPQQHQ